MEKELEKIQGDEKFIPLDITNRILLPVGMIWKPKEDITTYELAMCLPYLFRHCNVMPYEIDESLSYFRHFEFIDHNKEK
jgi:hypothetical protein